MTRSQHVGVAFHRAWAFWTGTGMVAVGVLLHLPDFAAAAAMHYRMAGMPMGLPMRVGMVLIGCLGGRRSSAARPERRGTTCGRWTRRP